MKNIYQSITAILEEVPAIGKNKKNTTQNFMFRGIDDVMNTFQPLLAKYKVFIVPQVLEQTREERQTTKGGTLIYSICKIKYTFYAEDGTSVDAIVVGEGMDSGDKATNKAMAIAMKYAMFQVFCIPTEEMKDPDGDTPPTSQKKIVLDYRKKLIAYCKEKNIDMNKVAEDYQMTGRKLSNDDYYDVLCDLGWDGEVR
jgi:hypothetical protein